MHPILQRFEFSYDDGEKFWDHSGELAFKMRKLMPGLRVTGSAAEQRDFVDDAAQREMFFGISLAALSSTAEGDEDFIGLAAAFLRELALSFEVQWLKRFTFRHALGRRCRSHEEAHALFWRAAGEGAKERVDAATSGGQVHALQLEFHQNFTEVVTRFVVQDLASDRAFPAKTYPYFAVVQEVTGTRPLGIGAFDAEAFMRNVAARHLQQVLAQVGPEVDE